MTDFKCKSPTCSCPEWSHGNVFAPPLGLNRECKTANRQPSALREWIASWVPSPSWSVWPHPQLFLQKREGRGERWPLLETSQSVSTRVWDFNLEQDQDFSQASWKKKKKTGDRSWPEIQTNSPQEGNWYFGVSKVLNNSFKGRQKCSQISF